MRLLVDLTPSLLNLAILHRVIQHTQIASIGNCAQLLRINSVVVLTGLQDFVPVRSCPLRVCEFRHSLLQNLQLLLQVGLVLGLFLCKLLLPDLLVLSLHALVLRDLLLVFDLGLHVADGVFVQQFLGRWLWHCETLSILDTAHNLSDPLSLALQGLVFSLHGLAGLCKLLHPLLNECLA